VLISANSEWQAIQAIFAEVEPQFSPLGEWFIVDLLIRGQVRPVLFFHGGWGKIAAAASTEYVIGRWSPRLLVNLGTCGGLAGEIEKGAIILVERTIVYDIIEQMGDYAEHIAHYTTELDLSWLEPDYPQLVRRTLLVSADRDLRPEDLPRLKAEFGAVAGDWESGAIAWVAARHQTPCLILRGVTDLVGPGGGEAYEGNIQVFVAGTREIMARLVPALPEWLAKINLRGIS
jgi:adenosylhomocysteine nucleosidase